MKIVINALDGKSIDKAIKQVNQYKREVMAKEKLLLQKLSEYGVNRVNIHYSWFQYDGDFSGIEAKPIVGKNKAIIQAKGQEIAFIEFGTGVYYNGAESYPLPRPEGIVGIGQYGKGRGNNPRGWYFTSSHGTSQYTKGNPPAMAFYKTTNELAEILTDIAREVFKS